jgi:N-acetylglucosaminyldiphosphoundecaprenol N-acetyl-beta-D-mannosaminyltransferase
MQREILGVKVDFALTLADVVKKAEDIIEKKEPGKIISTTNPFFIMEAQNDPDFKEIVNNAELSIPDGVGVLYANYYLRLLENFDKKNFFYPFNSFLVGLWAGFYGYLSKEILGEAITGVNLTDELFKLANKKGYTIFLLGGRRRDRNGKGMEDNYDMAKNVSSIVMSKYPNIKIIGASSQYSREAADDANTLSFIHGCMKDNGVKHIDILLVAYNPVMQEKWIHRNAINIPATLSIGIGRTFDYITNVMRPPNNKYVKAHLGWLYTFIKQPWRYKRIIKTFPLFPLKVYLSTIKK